MKSKKVRKLLNLGMVLEANHRLFQARKEWENTLSSLSKAEKTELEKFYSIKRR